MTHSGLGLLHSYLGHHHLGHKIKTLNYLVSNRFESSHCVILLIYLMLIMTRKSGTCHEASDAKLRASIKKTLLD